MWAMSSNTTWTEVNLPLFPQDRPPVPTPNQQLVDYSYFCDTQREGIREVLARENQPGGKRGEWADFSKVSAEGMVEVERIRTVMNNEWTRIVSTPEYKAWAAGNQTALAAHKATYFCDALTAGMYLVLSSGRRVLIGHGDEDGGCSTLPDDIDSSEIVVRYTMVALPD